MSESGIEYGGIVTFTDANIDAQNSEGMLIRQISIEDQTDLLESDWVDSDLEHVWNFRCLALNDLSKKWRNIIEKEGNFASR